MGNLFDCCRAVRVPAALNKTSGCVVVNYDAGKRKRAMICGFCPARLARRAAKPYAFLHSQFNEMGGQFSPDGHWIAYQSDESGRNEIYVVPFPGPGGKRQISAAGGRFPRWRADAKEIFYVGGDQRLMVAEVAVKGGEVETGEVHPLSVPVMTSSYRYDVSADGQRILAVTPRLNGSEALTIVQNWRAGLKK